MHISTDALPKFDDSQIRGAESEDEDSLCTGHSQKTQVSDRRIISSDGQKNGI